MKLISSILLLVVLVPGINSVYAQMAGAPGPHLLVYKTNKKNRKLVPVLLSDDKKSIISYPAPSDINAQGDAVEPTRLKRCYLMDNRGIGENVAFINMTYQEYGKLKTAPTVNELYSMIDDKDPLTELYDCGVKRTYTDPKAEANAMIRNKTLSTRCKVVKKAK